MESTPTNCKLEDSLKRLAYESTLRRPEVVNAVAVTLKMLRHMREFGITTHRVAGIRVLCDRLLPLTGSPAASLWCPQDAGCAVCAALQRGN